MWSRIRCSFDAMNLNPFQRVKTVFVRMFLQTDSLHDEAMEGMKEVTSFGLMASSAIVSPALVDVPKIWKLDIVIFVTSSGAFMFRHRDTIKKHGPLVLPLATVLGIGAYSSARTPLRELLPWMPIAISLFILLTTYSMPRIFPFFMEPAPVDYQVELEEGTLHLHHESSMEVGSIQTLEDHQNQEESPMMARYHNESFMNLQVSHMDRGAPRTSSVPSTHDSDIDLDDQGHVKVAPSRCVSPTKVGIFTALPMTFAETGYPTPRFTAGPSQPFHPGDTDPQRPSSPDTQAAQCASSRSAESETPLLG